MPKVTRLEGSRAIIGTPVIFSAQETFSHTKLHQDIGQGSVSVVLGEDSDALASLGRQI